MALRVYMRGATSETRPILHSQSRSADRRSGRSPTQSTTASSPSWFDNAEAMPSSERLRI